MEKDTPKPQQPDSKESAASNENDPCENPLGFNPDALKKEFQDLVEKKFGGKVQVLSMDEQFGLGEDDFELEDEKSEPSKETLDSIAEFDYKPKDIAAYLDRYVIGQDATKQALAIAVCDHYNHLKAVLSDSKIDTTHYQKQNVMVMGPTGVGKTFLIRLISNLVGVPFVKADATRFSEVGYMGANVDDIIRDLVQMAGGDIELASKGIVYVDEVDKLASRRDHAGRDVSGRGVQFGFLRLLENSDVDLNSSHDIASQFKTFMNFQKKGKAEKEIVSTKDILFIFSGAFHGIEEIVSQRLSKKSIGLHTEKKKMKTAEALEKVESQDLVEYGFEHEFIGRLPIRVSCSSLGIDDLFKILTESEDSIIKQYKESFAHYGIDLSFEKEALKLIAEKAFEQKTGARGLAAVLEELLRAFKFELPSTRVRSLNVTVDLVKNPQGFLHHLISN